MYCTRCGAVVSDSERTCTKCGEQVVVRDAHSPPAPPNHLVAAILITVLFCMPVGIVAIVFAATSASRARAGDYEAALRAAHKAKIWCWISFGLGMVLSLAVAAAAVLIVLRCFE